MTYFDAYHPCVRQSFCNDGFIIAVFPGTSMPRQHPAPLPKAPGKPAGTTGQRELFSSFNFPVIPRAAAPLPARGTGHFCQLPCAVLPKIVIFDSPGFPLEIRFYHLAAPFSITF
jgi:hypothetical protein